jgi:Winged helix DNA-binding domain
VVEHLVGMQAQEPRDPYVGLWTRLEGFDPHELGRLVAERRAVRSPLMRTTLHLVSARDCLTLDPLLRPVLERGFWTGTPFGRKLKGLDVDAVVAAGRALLDEQPRTNAQLRTLLSERWPGYDPSSLAYAVHHLVPVVQIPPRGVWGQKGLPTWATTATWLGRPVDPHPSIDELVLRYLAAFGPAGVMDVQAWTGLTRLREVVDRLRPRLRPFRDESGRELFDLPDAPRPDPDTPVPVRFLPQYDNVTLSHADRSHIAGDAAQRWPTDGLHWSGLLVDGVVGGAWRVEQERRCATLTVRLLEAVRDPAAVEEEAARLCGFLVPEAGRRTVELVAR